MLLAGVGFLLPYNSFITDVDYLHDKFKGATLRRGTRPPPRDRPRSRTGHMTRRCCVFQGRPSCST